MGLTRREFLATLPGIAAAASFPGRSFGSGLPSGRYAIAGTILTGHDHPPLKEHLILVNNGRIDAVIPTRPLSDRPLIRIPGTTIMPGIINAHCHRIHTPEERRERWLKHGVTSIGDVAAPLDRLPHLAESASGTTATAAFTGPMLAPPGGYPLPVHSADHAIIVDSHYSARDTVRKLADHGATMIKISFEPGVLPGKWPHFDRQTVATLCTEARRLGMTIRCHVEDLSGLEPALEAGVHCIEHVPHRWSLGSQLLPVLQRKEPVRHYRLQLERMVRDDVILTPTLDVLSRSIWDGPDLYEPVRAFHTMGGRIALGNDFPYRRTDAGMPLREMELLVRAGLSNSDVVRAGTRISAQACNLNTNGTIEPGMTADLLIIQGDPLTDLNRLALPLHVIKDGMFIS